LSSADRAELLDALGEELTRLTRLVENLLDLSRLHAEAAVPHAELWDVGELVALAVEEAGVPVELLVDEGLPAARVDATQTQRILVNLIDNARKFSPPGSPITVSARERDGGLVVEVADRGPGLSAADAVALLEPFVRGRAVVRGAGLGLAIARGFAVANGGALAFEPREGGGTRALVTLPAERVAVETGG
jgi:two-component system sensor histidine kinase KdpD